MQITHRFLSHARLVLGGFVLAVLVAASAPMLRPLALQWVCGVQGPVLLVEAAPDVEALLGEHGLECALCLLVDTPVAVPPQPVLPPAGTRAASSWLVIEADRQQLARAPLPARGPPLLS